MKFFLLYARRTALRLPRIKDVMERDKSKAIGGYKQRENLGCKTHCDRQRDRLRGTYSASWIYSANSPEI